MFMHNVLHDEQIPNDSKVAIEYKIPQTAKRVDFILSGKNIDEKSTAIIIELKQWSKAAMTEMDGVVSTFVGGSIRNVSHPSYQAWSYASLLEDYNGEVQKEKIELVPCAYLHNYTNDDVINNNFYQEYIDKAPLFFKHDSMKLR